MLCEAAQQLQESKFVTTYTDITPKVHNASDM